MAVGFAVVVIVAVVVVAGIVGCGGLAVEVVSGARSIISVGSEGVVVVVMSGVILSSLLFSLTIKSLQTPPPAPIFLLILQPTRSSTKRATTIKSLQTSPPQPRPPTPPR